jgi:hypothetical protein
MDTFLNKLDDNIRNYERRIKELNEIKKGLIDGNKEIIIEYRQNLYSQSLDWILQTMKETENYDIIEMHKIANEELEQYDNAFNVQKSDWKQFFFHRYRFGDYKFDDFK